MIHVIESFTCPKTGIAEKNEDMLYVGEHFVAVVDGSTSQGIITGKSEGRLTAELIVGALDRLPYDSDGASAVAFLQNELADYLKGKENIDLGAVAVIYSIARKEIWLVGDCQCAINGKVHTNAKEVDVIMAAMRSMLIQSLLAQGYTEKDLLKHDISRDMIEPLLKEQTHLRNIIGGYGYPCLCGKKEVTQFSVFQVNAGDEVILASDGYPRLFSTLAQSEQALKKLIEVDPLLYREYHSTKGLRPGNTGFDDRTYIRFVVD